MSGLFLDKGAQLYIVICDIFANVSFINQYSLNSISKLPERCIFATERQQLYLDVNSQTLRKVKDYSGGRTNKKRVVRVSVVAK